jgi:hypothetical protein
MHPYHTFPSGLYRWDRDVNKLVTDMEGGDRNTGHDGMQLHSLTPRNVYTVASGDFGDELWMCTTPCPGSGETDATQFPGDLANDFQCTLAANAFRYTCSGNYVNGH